MFVLVTWLRTIYVSELDVKLLPVGQAIAKKLQSLTLLVPSQVRGLTLRAARHGLRGHKLSTLHFRKQSSEQMRQQPEPS